MFFECSAKTGFNIEEVFCESAKQIARKINEGYYDLSNEVMLIMINYIINRAVVSKEAWDLEIPQEKVLTF